MRVIHLVALVLVTQTAIPFIGASGEEDPPPGFFTEEELVVGRERIVRPAPPPDADGPGGGGSGGYAGPAPGGSNPNLNDPCPTWRDPTACARYYDTLPIVGEADPAPEPVAADPVRAITMADIARFMPLVGELVVEPDGWGVVGTPTNFYATAETHTMDGELFDTAIQVRWTPSSYRFDYGDGTVEETEAAGSA